MAELIGIPPQVLFGQLLLGLINGSFYALLSLGLAVIFGMLNVINFAHGALYMTGAFTAYFLLQILGIGYWPALLLAPLIVGALGIVIEKTHARPALPARPPLRPAPDLRPRADHRGPVPQLLRRLGPALPDPGGLGGRPQPRLHVPADLPRLGDRRVADRLLRHLVPDRAHAAWRLPARRHREPGAGARLRHQRAADDDADLRLRRRRSRPSRACSPRRSTRSTR